MGLFAAKSLICYGVSGGRNWPFFSKTRNVHMISRGAIKIGVVASKMGVGKYYANTSC